VVDVPPHVVGQVLVAAVGLPLADHLERVVVEQRHAAGALLAVAAEAGHEQPAGPAVHGVRPGVAGPLAELVGLEHLDDLRGRRVVLDVQHVQPGGPQPGDDQVLPAAVVVPAARAERAGAGVPAEVVQLVAEIGQLGEADHGAVAGRGRVDVDHGDRVRLVGRAGEGGHVRELLGRRGRRVPGRAVERRVGVMLAVVVLIGHGAYPS
jgi:hypothetical protein